MSHLDVTRADIPLGRPRILHVGPLPARPEGGIAAYLLGLLASPVGERFAFTVVDTTVSPRLRRWRILRPSLSLRLAVRLAGTMARSRPHLVHIHTSDGAGFWEKAVLAEIAHMARRPVFLHLHGGDFERFLANLSPARARLAKHVLGRATRVLILAESWRPLVERFAAAERIALLPNAIHTGEFASGDSPAGRPRLLFLGMLSERKGLDDLRTALQQLSRDGSLDFDCDIVGGEEVLGARAHYERTFQQAGLSRWVHFHGPAFGEDKRRFLHRSHVFVLPSRAESFGIANLEAMAAGLAVISTRTGAIPEYLVDGVHGLLVAPGDATALAGAIARSIADPELRLRLGAAARRRAQEYDWSVVGKRLQDLYASALGSLNAVTDPTASARKPGSSPPPRVPG